MHQVARLQNQIEQEVKKYNQMAKKGQAYIQARNTLYQQDSQNSLVLKQMQLLPENAKVYKQVGGILIDQTVKEAKNTLMQRIGYITTQIKSTDDLIKKNQAQQKAMVEKITKAKEMCVKMMQAVQGQGQ